MVDEAKLQSLKVPELKALLSQAGLAVSGNKADLVARLVEHEKSKPAQDAPAPTSTAEEDLLAFDEAAPESNKETKSTAALDPPAPGAPEPSEATPSATPAAAPGAASSDAAPAPVPEPEPEPEQAPEPSSEELKESALAELNKRLKRLEKFDADPEQAAEITKQITRIEKFGVSDDQLVKLGLKQLNSGIATGGRREQGRGRTDQPRTRTGKPQETVRSRHAGEQRIVY